MWTTMETPEELMGQVRRVAQQEGASLRALVEEGLQRSLEARRQAVRRRLDFPVQCRILDRPGVRLRAPPQAWGRAKPDNRLRLPFHSDDGKRQDTTRAKYSIKLGKLSSASVTVTIGGHSGTDLTVNPTSLTLTTGNWNTAQDVTVTAGNDSDTTGDTATLTHSATGGGYGSVSIPSVTVRVDDIHNRGTTVSETPGAGS